MSSTSAAVPGLPRGEVDGSSLEGIGGPFLDRLGPERRARLANGASRVSISSGDVVFPNYEDQTGIVVSGITRLFIRARDGRQLSLRYARPGAMIGTLTSERLSVTKLTVQAVTDGEVVVFDQATFLDLVANDAIVGAAAVDEVARRLDDMYTALAVTTFGDTQVRIMRHLLELAVPDPDSRLLVASVTQQGLADAIGSAREVVTRSLGAMREAGLVETTKGQVVLLDIPRIAGTLGGWLDR